MINIFKLKTEELKTLVKYKEVLENDVRFPKNFWTNEGLNKNEFMAKCRILTRYCLENLAHIEVVDLPGYNLKQIKQMLINGRLFGMVLRVFRHDILNILKNAYPEEFKQRILREWMWSKHGLWQESRYIIEAVQYMVNSEGIRRIEDIPSLDWKNKLLKYGIYNVLSYFNWSIYNLFNFVYPGKFHPSDFKYKIKWAVPDSLENAFHHMHKVFKKNRYTMDDILTLNTSDFRRLGLAGMLNSLFDSSILKAKEYYLYKTIGNKKHQQELQGDISRLAAEKQDSAITKRLSSAASGKYIYNMHLNSSLYSYIKRHSKKNGMTIDEFVSKYGFIYKTFRNDTKALSPESIWELRKKGLTYVQIAQELGSNPNTVSQICIRHFGGDPLIPRPLQEYVTVQELMDKYHTDHKTIMKIVTENNFENHMTIRFRYLKRSEIEPALTEYINNSKQHQSMVKRYGTDA